MDKTTIILLVISAVLAVTAAYFQYFFKVKERSQYLYWLSFFRFIAILCLLLLLVNPSVKKINYRYEKPNLNVVVDNSKSIGYLNNDASVNEILNNLKQDDALTDKFNVNYFSFGTKVASLDSLNFEDNYTDIGRVFRTFSDFSEAGESALILLTDGNETTGASINNSTSNTHVFPFIIGDTTLIEDLSIDRLNVNPTTFLNNNAPVEIFVNYEGNRTISSELSLYQDDIQIATKTLAFSKSQNAASVSFFIPAIKEGRHYYSARIAVLENEVNVQNNVKSFALNVIQEQAKILVLSDVVHPDLGMLKTSIESNKEREVVLKNVDDNYDLSDIDLVILYQPTQKFEAVLDRLYEDEINYLLISGLATDWSFLNNAQTNYTRETVNSEEDFSAVYNEDYSTFLTEPIEVDQWPPLQHTFGRLKISLPHNMLLLQEINGILTREPILATFENGNQKVGLWMGENIWRWRLYNYKETGNFEDFDGFMSNLIQYLSSKKQKNRLNVSHKELFYANESVAFTASYLDDNLNFDPKAQIELSVFKTDESFSRSVPFTAYTSTFKTALSGLPVGTYNYTVKVLGETISKSGSFKIAAYNLEEQFSTSQWENLNTLAINSGGKLYFENDLESMKTDLVGNPAFQTVQIASEEKTPLIELKFLLIAIVAALGLEWFLRKYYGKI